MRALCPELDYTSPRLLFNNSIKVEGNVDIKFVINETSVEKEIHVGFLSSHFYDHSIGRMLYETLYYLQNEEADVGIKEKKSKIVLTVFFIDALLPRWEDVNSRCSLFLYFLYSLFFNPFIYF